MGWRRAKHSFTSPDPEYARKEVRDRLSRLARPHPDWALGFEDETWRSRVAFPALHTWATADRPLRLSQARPKVLSPSPLPAGARLEQIKADYKDGILEIRVPMPERPKVALT